MSRVKGILFDFDGVIIESNSVREYGFRKSLEAYPNDLVEDLVNYHNANGGLSRYHKYEYFFTQILRQKAKEGQVMELANAFSEIMRKELGKKKYLIAETVEFIKQIHQSIPLKIVSGSDQEELRFLCNNLEVDQYFKAIFGSPVAKTELVRRIIEQDGHSDFLLIGDSVNDFEAARDNDIAFVGYNNSSLRELGSYYIDDYNVFTSWLNEH
ncbi:HAD-IA family hydrolase [Bacteroidia bacterium]|jgi:HAD superfamily hydrolase (TIGR01549 family)|nr:HAD-IA family hydrolase [Bacteroidia bacterium]